MGPAAILTLRAMLDWQLLHWETALLPIGIFWGVSSFVVLVWHATNLKKDCGIVPAVILNLMLAYGVVVPVNGFLDNEGPTLFSATVLEKTIDKSQKNGSYHFKLSPWGPRTLPDTVDVGKKIYSQVEEGDVVQVHLHPGYLEVPWFHVRFSEGDG